MDQNDLKLKEVFKQPSKDSKNLFSLYLNEVNAVPLLTKEQEQELGKKIKSENKKARQKAIREMVEKNLRLVVYLAKNYANRANRGIEIEDLVQEGNLGLLRAAEKFDPKMGKFSTYARWWIIKRITDILDEHSHAIRIPNLKRNIRKYMKARHRLYQELKREPTLEEVAKRTRMKKETLEAAARNLKVFPLSQSLGLGDRWETKVLQDLIENEKSPNPEKELEKEELRRKINKLLDTLTQKEKKVIKGRFEKEETLEKIAQDLGLTRERVRQIEAKALNKLRKKAQKFDLEKFFSK